MTPPDGPAGLPESPGIDERGAHPAVHRGRRRGVRAAGREIPSAGVASGLPGVARPRGGLGRGSGGIRAGVSFAVVVPWPVGVLHLALPHHRERGHRSASAARRAGARLRAGAGDRGGMDPQHARSGTWAGSGSDAAEQRERIRRALDALPPKARTIIMLSDVEGLSYREIAEVLNCPIGTVMSRLHNARKRLKGLLGPMLVLILWLGLTLGWAHAGRGAADHSLRRPHLHGGLEPPPQRGRDHRGALRDRPAPTPEAETDERMKSDPAPGSAPSSVTPTTPRSTASASRGRSAPSSGSRCPASGGSRSRPDQLHGDHVRMRVRLLRGVHPEVNAAIQAAPGAPAVSAGPPYGNGVLIIILWANPNPAPCPRVSEQRYRQERARIEQGHVKYREKLKDEGQALRPRPPEAPPGSRDRSSRRTSSSRATRSRTRPPTAWSPGSARSAAAPCA